MVIIQRCKCLSRAAVNIFASQKIDAYEFYMNEEVRLTALVEEEKKVALTRPLGVAFVTLGKLLLSLVPPFQ